MVIGLARHNLRLEPSTLVHNLDYIFVAEYYIAEICQTQLLYI